MYSVDKLCLRRVVYLLKETFELIVHIFRTSLAKLVLKRHNCLSCTFIDESAHFFIFDQLKPKVEVKVAQSVEPLLATVSYVLVTLKESKVKLNKI